MQQAIVWFSCGAASAAAADFAVKEYGKENVELIYCDTLKYEHPDNKRFMHDVEKWLDIKIKIIRSEEYTDIFDVFEKKNYLVGNNFAPCTVELKIKPRLKYQEDHPDAVHIFGFTVDEKSRFMNFASHNENIEMEFILGDNNITKDNCFAILNKAGIKLPEIYYLGFNNANCIGCVRAANLAYWGRIKHLGEKAEAGDESLIMFKGVYDRMAKMERKIGATINKDQRGGVRKPIYLDEMTEADFARGRTEDEPNTECGVLCSTQGNLFEEEE